MHFAKNKAPITSLDQLNPSAIYTYADYLTWQFNERVELIWGKIFKMSPAPNSYHQEISINVSTLFRNYLKRKKCKVYSAPFDVRLLNPKLKNGKILNVVQPDLSVICDLTKIDDAGCLGAPDLIIEILSSSTAEKDRTDKFELYEKNGVQEYWMIEPYDKTAIIYVLNENKKFIAYNRPYINTDKVQVHIFQDLIIDLSEVFN